MSYGLKWSGRADLKADHSHPKQFSDHFLPLILLFLAPCQASNAFEGINEPHALHDRVMGKIFA